MKLSRSFKNEMALTQSSSKYERMQILPEEEFVAQLDSIIERDFFPDLANMRKNFQNEEDKLKDYHDLQQKHYSSSDILCESFDTPQSMCLVDLQKNKPNETQLSLGEFLTKYTSEDNASFVQIMEEAKKRHQRKYPWMYHDERILAGEITDSLALPSAQQQIQNAIDKQGKPLHLTMWPYRNKNSLMYNPDSAPFTQQELIKLAVSNKQQIRFENTRFSCNPFDERRGKQNIAEAARSHAMSQKGKMDAQGREISICDDHVRVNGYSIVPSTPLIEPGVEATPLMTWGEVDSTPCALDKNEPWQTPDIRSTPSTHQFKIPGISNREKLAHTLTDKISKSHRDKKRLAVEQARSSLTPCSSSLFKSGTPKTPKISDMSPAAQRLARKTLGINHISDSKLGSSYGSPFSSYKTPNIEYKSSNTSNTPKTPSITSKNSSKIAVRRKKAQEFF